MIQIPGSKSITNRLLILAAFCEEAVTITNCATSTDSKYLLAALQTLGATVEQKNDTATISNQKAIFANEPKEIYTGNAGTTTRFLTAFGTLLEREITIDGDSRMRQRPIGALAKALNTLGANVQTTNNCPPLKIAANKPHGGLCLLPGDISSQYLSAILMIAPFLDQPTTIEISGDLCSKPYVDLTIAVMRQFGLEIKNENYQKFLIAPQKIQKPGTIAVESDASSASYIGALAIISQKPQTIANLRRQSLQGDIAFLDLLEKIGCAITEKDHNLTITPPETLKPLGTIDMNAIPDLVMTFAVLAPLLPGKTTITNIANLRIKECDRLAALETELQRLGVSAQATADSLTIEGPYNPPNSPTLIHTYDDHRIAMSFGLLTKIFPQIEIENPACVEKSYPDFWKEIKAT